MLISLMLGFIIIPCPCIGQVITLFHVMRLQLLYEAVKLGKTHATSQVCKLVYFACCCFSGFVFFCRVEFPVILCLPSTQNRTIVSREKNTSYCFGSKMDDLLLLWCGFIILAEWKWSSQVTNKNEDSFVFAGPLHSVIHTHFMKISQFWKKTNKKQKH